MISDNLPLTSYHLFEAVRQRRVVTEANAEDSQEGDDRSGNIDQPESFVQDEDTN